MRTNVIINLVIFVLSCNIANAQTDSLKNNEIGLNISPFFTYVFSNNYNPLFNISYRRYIGKNAIRTRLLFSNYKQLSDADNIDISKEQKQFDFNIGYQRFSFLTKKWSIFWGLDFNYGNNYSYSSNVYANSYVGEQVRDNTHYGLGALIGFKYYINNRISISSEMNYFYMLKKENITSRYKLISNNSVSIPDNSIVNLNTTYTEFTPPINMIISFNF